MRLRTLRNLFVPICLLILNSCGGGNLPIIRPTSPIAIKASHNIPDNDIEIPFAARMVSQPGGQGLLMLRRASSKDVVLEHYTPDSLSVDWSIPIPMEKGDSWSPALRLKAGTLYMIGLEYYNGYDSVGIRAISVDPATHKITSDMTLSKKEEIGAAGNKAFKALLYSYDKMVVSPDTNTVLFYQENYSDIIDRDKDKLDRISVSAYDITRKPLGSREVVLPVPQQMDFGYYYNWLEGIFIDNGANIYTVVYSGPDSMIVRKSSIQGGASEMLAATFPDVSMNDRKCLGWPAPDMDPVSGIVTLATGRVVHGETLGIDYATFDFNSHAVHAYHYDPDRKMLDNLIDQKTLEDYMVTKVIRTNQSARTVVILEKVNAGTYTNSIDGTTNPKYTYTFTFSYRHCLGVLACGFDDAGAPLWQYPLPKDQSNTIDYFTNLKDPSTLSIFYTDRDTKLEGLQECNIDLVHGLLSPVQNIFQFGSDTYMLGTYSIWNGPDAIMIAAGSTTWGGQLRMRNPMILRLGMQ